jgi:hypothetical protein
MTVTVTDFEVLNARGEEELFGALDDGTRQVPIRYVTVFEDHNPDADTLAASATMTSGVCSVGVAAGELGPHAAFVAFASADQAGHVYVEATYDDGATWHPAKDSVLSADSGLFLSIYVIAPKYRVQLVNSSDSLMSRVALATAFTAAPPAAI